MPRPIRSIDIYLPLDYNDGRAVEESKFVGLQQQLLTRFGGVTSTHRDFPLQGLWKSEGQVFQDRVVVFSVMDFRTETAFEIIRYLERLKARLRKKFDQLDLLITVQDLLAI
jgi:hypothetical protein